MRVCIFLTFFVSIFGANKSIAQSYVYRNLAIDIASKQRLIVQDYNDFNLNITLSNRSARESIETYNRLAFGKSTLGNIFFELHKYDSVSGGFLEITSKVTGIADLAIRFNNEEERLKFDPPKTPLRAGEKRVLVFNLLDIIHYIPPGNYALKIYFRVGNNYGYDRLGHIITNCMQYVESIMMPFEINTPIEAPRKREY